MWFDSTSVVTVWTSKLLALIIEMKVLNDVTKPSHVGKEGKRQLLPWAWENMSLSCLLNVHLSQLHFLPVATEDYKAFLNLWSGQRTQQNLQHLLYTNLMQLKHQLKPWPPHTVVPQRKHCQGQRCHQAKQHQLLLDNRPRKHRLQIYCKECNAQSGLIFWKPEYKETVAVPPYIDS